MEGDEDEEEANLHLKGGWVFVYIEEDLHGRDGLFLEFLSFFIYLLIII